MSLITTKVEWHDLRIDDCDLPGEEEPVLITVEALDGQRLVWHDAYFKFTECGDDIIWCTMALNEFGRPEETAVWYPVIAWAYLPEPYDV